MKEATKAEKQAAIRKEAQSTLAKLYKIHRGAKSAIPRGQSTLARGHAAVAARVVRRSPGVICQTRTPAAPGSRCLIPPQRAAGLSGLDEPDEKPVP
jgi:hypothetical protein